MTELDPVIQTIIAEAANQDDEGMYAVASAIINRSKRRRLTPEEVVKQAKQFSGWERPDRNEFIARQPGSVVQRAMKAWERAKENPIPGLDHYLTNKLYNSPKAPKWSKQYGGKKIIGDHIFMDSYKGPDQATLSPEDDIYKMNHIMTRAGFEPMNVDEIEGMLKQAEAQQFQAKKKQTALAAMSPETEATMLQDALKPFGKGSISGMPKEGVV